MRIEGQVCKCSYTLNNRQNVTCTIIGDRPMAYCNGEEISDD